MAKPLNLSSVAINETATPTQQKRSSFDPTFGVDVVEPLIFADDDGTLNRMAQITTPAVSAGRGVVAVGLIGHDGTNYQRVLVSASKRLLVSGTVAGGSGTNPVSALLKEGTAFAGQVSATIKNYPLVVSGTVSAKINEGSVSATQTDAGKFHVSAYQAGTWTPHIESNSADNVRISAFSKDATDTLVSTKSDDAGEMRVSAIGDVSAVLKGGTAFIGNTSATIKNYPLTVSGQVSANIDSGSVSAKSNDADQLRVSALSKDAALNRVSAIGGTAGDNVLVDGADQTISASLGADGLVRMNVVSGGAGGGIVTQSDAANLMVSTKSDNAALMRVSAIGGTAGDNVLVDGSDQSVSAKLIQVSAAVSSNMNTLVTRMTSYDAANAHVSAYQGGSWTLSAFINEGSVSAQSTDADQLHVSAVQGDASLFHVSAVGDISAILKGGTAFIGNTSSIIKNYPLTVSGTVSAKINEGSVSAKQGTSPWIVSGTVDSEQTGTWAISALGKEGTAFLGNVSATVKNYPLNVSGTVSTAINEGTNFLGNISATVKNYPLTVSGTVSSFINEGSVSAIQPDASNLLVSAKSGDGDQLHVSAVQGDAGLFHISAFTAPWTPVSAAVEVGTVTSSSIYDPGGGTIFNLTDLVIGTTSAVTVTVFYASDTTTNRVFKSKFPEYGGMVWPLRTPKPGLSAAAVLKVTTDAPSANITVHGYET
jgi:hypothetical protein